MQHSIPDRNGKLCIDNKFCNFFVKVKTESKTKHTGSITSYFSHSKLQDQELPFNVFMLKHSAIPSKSFCPTFL